MNPGAWQTGKPEHGYGLVQWTPANDKYLAWSGCGEGTVKTKVEKKSTRKELMKSQLRYLLYSCEKSSDEDHYQWYQNLSGNYGYENSMTFDEFRKSTSRAGYLAAVFNANYERNYDYKTWKDGKTLLAKRYDDADTWYTYLSTIK